MFRVSLANAFAKRSLRPLHEKHQATPVQVLLNEADPVYSGMGAELTSDGTVKIFSGGICYGLFALDKNTVIDDTNGQPTDLGSATNGTPFAVWQGGPDAYFRVTDPGAHEVIDSGASFTVGGTVKVLDADGKLDDSGGTGTVIGQVVEVIAAHDIVIRLEAPNVSQT